MKKCKGCERELSFDQFYVKDRATGRLCARCKDCDKANRQAYYRANKDRIKSNVRAYQKANPEVQARAVERRRANGKRRAADIKAKYGISRDQYEGMLERAGHVCEICGRDPREVSKKGYCIDHCHDSGAVRGILCHPCNAALGNFRDDVDVMRRAIEYLEKSVVH